jgi:hypothetical protein
MVARRDEKILTFDTLVGRVQVLDARLKLIGGAISASATKREREGNADSFLCFGREDEAAASERELARRSSK